MTVAFVTGGAGFIGSSLVDRLLQDGVSVTVYDDFSTGRDEFLANAVGHRNCTVVKGDILDGALLRRSMAGAEVVFHLAANADVRFGTEHPRRDLEQNTIGTFEVVEAARLNAVETVLFSSTGSVYGEHHVFPTPEDAPFPLQTSLYGASKLAGEALLSAYSEGFRLRTIVCRFVSVLGDRYTHGHVFDFVKSLRTDPSRLRVLGDGKQRKSYMHVSDCVDALTLLWAKAPATGASVYNLGADEYCQVDDSVGWICDELAVRPKVEHTGGERGWIGDSPFIFLDCTRVRALGWKPRYGIEAGVRATARYLTANAHLLERD